VDDAFASVTLLACYFVRRNTRNVKAVTLFIELNDLRCANISLTSYTSWSTCQKSTWWTVCWKTSLFSRSVNAACQTELCLLFYSAYCCANCFSVQCLDTVVGWQEGHLACVMCRLSPFLFGGTGPGPNLDWSPEQ